MSSVEQIEHFTGFGLYDKSFVQVMRDLKDPIPFLRGVVGDRRHFFNKLVITGS